MCPARGLLYGNARVEGRIFSFFCSAFFCETLAPQIQGYGVCSGGAEIQGVFLSRFFFLLRGSYIANTEERKKENV